MKVYEFGAEHRRVFVMFQCAAEPWWVFRASAEAMARDWHVFLVIADGHDELGTEFVSIEKNVEDAAACLRGRGVTRIDGLYGVSMGGASAMRFLATQDIPVDRAIIDAGITPYPYPRLVCRLIAIRDWVQMMLGTKSLRLMKLAMPPERWTPRGEDPEEHYRRISTSKSTTFPPGPSTTCSGPPITTPCPIPSPGSERRWNTGTARRKGRRAGMTWPTPKRRSPRSCPGNSRALPTRSWC